MPSGTDIFAVGAGAGGGPRVAVFDGTSLRQKLTPRRLFNDFFALDPALRTGVNVAALDAADTIVYTGWAMTAERLRMHNHSEAALHRWDLLGDDDIGLRLLADPAMVTHALAAFDALPALAEARRWRRPDRLPRPIALRSDGRPDVVVTPGHGLSATGDGHGAAIELQHHEVPLLLWGRCPPRLRDPNANAETLEDVLRRLCA